MASPQVNADSYLPDWTALRVVVLDASGRWAPAVHRETLDQLERQGLTCSLQVEACAGARDTLLCCEMKNTIGLVMFASESERDCLSVLGRLERRRRSLPTLIICTDSHDELVPVMYEAGADTVLFDVQTDIPVGAWCARVIGRAQMPASH